MRRSSSMVILLTCAAAACGGSSLELGHGTAESSNGSASASAPSGTDTPAGGVSGQPQAQAQVVAPGSGPVCGAAPPATCAAVSFNPALVSAVKGSGAGFKATVTKLNATTEPTFDASLLPRTAVVHVDSVLAGMGGTPFLGSFVGKEVTILFAAAPPVAIGFQGYFFVNTLVVGTGVVVQDVAHATLSTYPTIETDVPAITRTIADRALFDRLASAPVIAIGTVQSTKNLNAPEPGSEHDAQWWEGATTVGCTIKGSVSAGASLAVRYASSHDIAWYKAPKLTPPETNLFVLADDAVTKVPGPGGAAAYVVTDARDVQPTAELDKIVGLLACPPPAL